MNPNFKHRIYGNDNTNIQNGWDGTSLKTGEPCTQAVYYSRIVYTYTNGNDIEERGDGTLIR